MPTKVFSKEWVASCAAGDGYGGSGAETINNVVLAFTFVPPCIESQGARLTVELGQADCRKVKSCKVSVRSEGRGHPSPQAVQSWALAPA